MDQGKVETRHAVSLQSEPAEKEEMENIKFTCIQTLREVSEAHDREVIRMMSDKINELVNKVNELEKELKKKAVRRLHSRRVEYPNGDVSMNAYPEEDRDD